MDTGPFSAGADPFGGTPDFLKPNPPAAIPEAPGIGDAMASSSSPFAEPLDIDKIMANLVLDRPLKLFIPNMQKYPQYEFRIINSIPQEIADAHNKGFREVTEPEAVNLFTDLVAGTDKNGKAFRPLLVARPKAVGEHIRKQNRMRLASLYAGMDPANRDFESKYAGKVDKKDGTFLERQGNPWRIRF